MNYDMGHILPDLTTAQIRPYPRVADTKSQPKAVLMTKLGIADLQVWAWLLTIIVGIFFGAAIWTARSDVAHVQRILDARGPTFDAMNAKLEVIELNQSRIMGEQRLLDQRIMNEKQRNDAFESRQDKSDLRQDASRARETSGKKQ